MATTIIRLASVFDASIGFRPITSRPWPARDLKIEGLKCELLFALGVLHESPAFGYLPWRQSIFTPGVRVVAGFVFNADWRTLKIEGFAKGFFQVTCKVIGNGIGLSAVNNDQRRISTSRVSITQLNSPPLHHRWRVVGNGVFEYTGENIGGEFIRCRSISLVHRFIKIADASTVKR